MKRFRLKSAATPNGPFNGPPGRPGSDYATGLPGLPGGRLGLARWGGTGASTMGLRVPQVSPLHTNHDLAACYCGWDYTVGLVISACRTRWSRCVPSGRVDVCLCQKTRAGEGKAMKSPDVPAAGRPTGDAAARQQSVRADFPRPSAFSLSNWPVSRRLVAVIVMAVVMGLVFGGLRVAVSVDSANGFARTTQLALLGQQVTQLAQAMEDERDTSAGVAAYGEITPMPLPPTKALKRLYAPEQKQAADENTELVAKQHATDAIARQVQALAAGIGSSYPQNTQAKAAAVIAVIGNLSGLRTEWVGQAPQAAIQDYSGAIAQLFALNDEITSGSGDPTLADHVRTLDAMSRAKDQVSQQRAILYAALVEDTVGQTYGLTTALGVTKAALIGQQAMIDAGGLQALTTAQGLQQADLFAFTQSATP